VHTGTYRFIQVTVTLRFFKSRSTKKLQKSFTVQEEPRGQRVRMSITSVVGISNASRHILPLLMRTYVSTYVYSLPAVHL
jgi:hypothetical protein